MLELQAILHRTHALGAMLAMKINLSIEFYTSVTNDHVHAGLAYLYMDDQHLHFAAVILGAIIVGAIHRVHQQANKFIVF